MALPVGRQTVRKLRKTLSAPDFLKKKAIQRDEKSAVLGTVDSEISKSNKTTTKKKERARPDSRFEIGGFGTRRRRSIAPSTASVGRRGIFFLFDRRFPAIFRRPVLMTSRRRGAFIFGRSIGRHQIKRRNRDAGTIGFFFTFCTVFDDDDDDDDVDDGGGGDGGVSLRQVSFFSIFSFSAPHFQSKLAEATPFPSSLIGSSSSWDVQLERRPTIFTSFFVLF